MRRNRPAWKSTLSSPAFLVALIVSALYLVVLFPLCFFRHDDWWILGNSVLHLPGDWGFLFRPTLYFHQREIDWFFRPFFKLFTYLFFQAFSFHYYLWLVTLFALFAATLAVGYTALKRFSGRAAADTFLVFFAAAIPLHIGSLAWVGEGLMNIPQAFLLMSVTACWMELANRKKASVSDPALWTAIALFFLSLGFKESTVFHLALLAGLTLSEKKFQFTQRLPYWIRQFAPLALVGGVYLTIRLGLMPWNQSYKPAFSLPLWTTSLGKFWSVPLATAFLWIALDARFDLGRWKSWGQALIQRSWWIPYFGVSSAVYLGQNFFSPGWWYLPSLFLAFAIALCQADVGAREKKSQPSLALQATVCMLAFVTFSTWQLNQLGWQHWGGLQRQLHQAIVRANPQQIRRIALYECSSPEFPAMQLSRVVGDDEAIRNHWQLVHGNRVHVGYRYCDHLERDLRTPASIDQNDEAVFVWKFPHIVPLGRNATFLFPQSSKTN
jgi:hypothetical protein